MKYQLREYQRQASNAAVAFFLEKRTKDNAIIVAATGCGKSLIIADIAYRLDSDVLVFCPTREITLQNYAKMKSYDVECSMYSASVGQKEISKITFATIGSVKKCHELFSHFKYVIVDEAHYVNSAGGMYKDFFDNIECKVLGLTATPYRLETEVEMNWKTKTIKTASSSLIMLTDYYNAIFKDIIYNVDAGDLTRMGFLSKMKYYNIPPRGWDNSKMFKNSSGSDYSDESVRFMQKKGSFQRLSCKCCQKAFKSKKRRKKKWDISIY